MTLLSCQQQTSESQQGEIQQYTIEQFMDNVSIFGGNFSHDESRILVSSDQSGIFNAYEIPIDGGTPKALTNSTDNSIFAISYFPDDDRLLYRMDNNGNELFHLFVKEQDGTVKELTPDSTARAVFYGWAHDNKSFFYGYNQRDRRFMDVYEMDISNYTPKLIMELESGYSFNGISDDKRYIVLSKAINTNDSDLYLYDTATKESKKISENKAGHSLADFSPNSKSVYYLTDDGTEFQHLAKYEIESGERKKVHEEKWDIWYAYFTHNGKYQIMGINEDGKTTVKVKEVESGKFIDFPKFKSGSVISVNPSRSENLMAFFVGGSNSPSNLYIYNVDSKEYKQLSNTLNKEINPTDLVTAEVIRFKSFDGLDIPAIFYKPHQASAENKVPALVRVHGGPGGQSRQSFDAQNQYLVNQGYAILAVNNRGSSGYGKTFFKMDDRNHGEKDLQDCVMGKEWLAQQDYIDAEKIGILGGSYGGFMVMAALTREPDAFEVGVNYFGVTNWLRTLKSIPPWWESFKDALYEEMGNPYEDSIRLYNISPLFHADKITKPVLVLQGATDPRVLQVESDEIVEAVKKNDVPVEYLLFEDEGHGFVKKENRIKAYKKTLTFLDKYLKQKPPLKS